MSYNGAQPSSRPAQCNNPTSVPVSFGDIQAMARDSVTNAAASMAEECVSATLRSIGYESQLQDAEARKREYLDLGHIKATLVPVACHIMQSAADEAFLDDKHLAFPPSMRLTDVYCRAFAKWIEWFPIIVTHPRFTEINARYARSILIKEFVGTIPDMLAPLQQPSDLAPLSPSMQELPFSHETAVELDSVLICREEMTK
jgi:hypothetical protein